MYVAQNLRSAPRRELGEVLSTGQSSTWVVDVAVVDLGGQCGGGRREWSTGRWPTWVVVDVAAVDVGGLWGGRRRGWWFVAPGRRRCGGGRRG